MAVLLHVKSHYSLGVGTASVEELVTRAADRGYRALALTDLESLGGQPELHWQCRRRGIRPISGVELRPGFSGGYVGARAGRLVLIAQDDEGYGSLCRIVSVRRGAAGSAAEQRAARDVVGALALSPAGLVALSDDVDVLEQTCDEGLLPADRLKLLLVRPDGSPRTPESVARAGRLGIAPLADADVVMLDARDHDVHRLQVAVRTGVRVTDLDPAEIEPASRSLPDPVALADRFADVPEALAATDVLAGACSFDLGADAPLLPGAEAFGGHDPARRLRERCTSALAQARREGRCRGPGYRVRIDTELNVITTLGYAGYFLAGAAIADAARDAGILIAPRGSAAGSLVVHVLGISPLDPVARGLAFERFLHARRTDPPDIDIDVDSEHRDALIGWVRRRFGADRVAMVGAYHTFRLKSALREGLQAVGAPAAEIRRVTAGLADERKTGEPAAAPDESALPAPAGPGKITRAWLPAVVRLVGKPRRLALHPAGVVIAGEPLARRLPLERGRRGSAAARASAEPPVAAALRGPAVSQYDLGAVQRAGFVKLDLLGSKVLSQLAECARLAGSAGNLADVLLDTSAGDPVALEHIDRADTIGCFQVETPTVRALLEQVPVRRLEDCVDVLALVRPGAAAGAAKRRYVSRAAGAGGRQPGHPWLRERLRHTHGVLLYDEDLIALLAEAGGITLAEADELRAGVIDAGADQADLGRWEAWYRERAVHANADPSVIRAVWRLAERFAAYSFCRAHAWSYAVQAHAAVHQKARHPAEFCCALMNHYGGAYPLRTVVADAVRHGVRVLAPSVNESEARAAPAPKGAVRVGLAHIKHVTGATVGRILDARRNAPFASVDDFLTRVRAGRREVTALVRVGACDMLPPLAPGLYPDAHEALLQGLAGELPPHAFERLVRGGTSRTGDEAVHRYRMLVRIRNELNYLEMHPSAHPLAVLRDEAERQGCVALSRVRRLASGERTRIAGVLAASRRHAADGREPLQFLTLEDETALLEAVIAPDRYRHLSRRLTTPGPYLVEGTVLREHGHVFLRVIDLRPFHERTQR